MVKRLKATGDAAQALAGGELSQRAPAGGADEIAEVSRHFNHMADRLQALVEGLQRSEKERRDLLVNVSHELRTPLTSIQGFAEALRDGVVSDDGRRQRYHEIIAGEAGRLSHLVTDLFEVSRFEAGQIDLRLREVPIAPWLVTVAEQMSQIAATDGRRFDLALGNGVEGARLYGDQDRLSQVITNLVSNAVRFTPEGGAVTLGARLDGGHAVITVKDEGPGILPEEKDRVFERFFQGKQKSAIAHRGAGLGLAIARSIVEAHGGHIGVEGEPGDGATFWFRVRLAEAT